MTNIRIVTDSTGDIPAAFMKQLQIEMVPLKVHFDQETFLDAVTILPEQFYKKLREATTLPTTSQPSPADFTDVYERILKEDPNQVIISIHLSSALSGTYQSAMVAKSQLPPEANITVIDSLSASYGCGMLAVAAAKAAQAGKNKEKIIELIEQIMQQSQLYFYVDTLEYLQKGGRIGKASALLGSLLQIKPILSIDDEGEVYSVDKVRGSKRAASKIVEMFRAKFGTDPVQVAIAHSDAPEEAVVWQKRLEEDFNVKEVVITKIGSVIGTHVGQGAVGIFMLPVIGNGSL